MSYVDGTLIVITCTVIEVLLIILPHWTDLTLGWSRLATALMLYCIDYDLWASITHTKLIIQEILYKDKILVPGIYVFTYCKAITGCCFVVMVSVDNVQIIYSTKPFSNGAFDKISLCLIYNMCILLLKYIFYTWLVYIYRQTNCIFNTFRTLALSDCMTDVSVWGILYYTYSQIFHSI